MVKAIVGAGWGDEGKGKITDTLASKADYVVRFQGGANAGHTIINNYGKFALHLLPSGVFHQNIVNVIGPGVAFNVTYFLTELNSLLAKGVKKPKIVVSNRVQLLMPYHILQDTYEEARLAGHAYGSTKSGIAPFYADKYAKIGIQISELYGDINDLKEKVIDICLKKNVLFEHLYHQSLLDPQEIMETLMQYKEEMKDYICDTDALLYQAQKEDKEILLEGQLGSLKDPDHGIYPMVTSSSTLAGFACVGAGIAPYNIKEIVAVAKAYSSAVGAGEFISEIHDEKEADELRHRGGDGGEYGATTGRPRRIGWLDTVAYRYGVQRQGATQVALTVVDVLGYLKEIPICVAYDIDGQITKDFPTTTELKKAKPVFIKMPGWQCDIRHIKNYNDLPQACKDYVEFIEKELGVKITMVSNGPNREDILYR